MGPSCEDAGFAIEAEGAAGGAGGATGRSVTGTPGSSCVRRSGKLRDFASSAVGCAARVVSAPGLPTRPSATARGPGDGESANAARRAVAPTTVTATTTFRGERTSSRTLVDADRIAVRVVLVRAV